MKVPFLDLRAAYDELADRFEPGVLQALRSGCYIGGQEVESFEQRYSKYCQADHTVAVANGLEALELALRAYGIGAGDEVIVPSNTFIATWLAVKRTGATLIPVEPSESTYNIEVDAIAEAITVRTKAIIPVHLYGQPANIDAIVTLAASRGIIVVEDAAQAQGASCRGKRIGGGAHAAAWSFYPAKNLGAFGDAGAITTNDPQIAKRLQMLRNYGSKEKYIHEIDGLNSRMDPLQAAVLNIKLDFLDKWNMRRKSIAQRYLEAFSRTSLVLPTCPDWSEPVWHLFVVRFSRRNWLSDQLAAREIQTQIHYPIAPHEQLAFAYLSYKPEAFPIAHRLSREVLSLPIGPHMKDAEVTHVIKSVQALLEPG